MTSSLSILVLTHKALAHPVRMRIVAMLARGELCVCQITAVLKLAPSTVSAHLRDLKRAGLLVERKDGRWVICSWASDAATESLLRDVVERVRRDPHIEADARLVERLRRIPVERLCRVGLDLDRLGLGREPRRHGAQGKRRPR